MRKKNPSIEGLRGILMLWIVLFHYTFQYNGLALGKTVAFVPVFNHGGEVGVMLFLVISGYYMSRSIISVTGGGEKWFFQRYLRLFSTYAVSVVVIWCWLWALPVPGRTVSTWTFICDLFLIAHPGIEYVDGAHWYIAALVEVQLLVAVICFIKPIKLRIYVLLFVFSVIVICKQIILRIGLNYSIELQRFMVGIEGSLIGMCIYLFKEYKVCIPILIVLILWFTHLSWLYALYIALFFLCVYQGNSKIEKVVEMVLGNRVLVWIGGISYAWYLIHQNIGYSIFYHFVPDNSGNLIWLLLTMLFTLGLAVIVGSLGNRIMQGIEKHLYHES